MCVYSKLYSTSEKDNFLRAKTGKMERCMIPIFFYLFNSNDLSRKTTHKRAFLLS